MWFDYANCSPLRSKFCPTQGVSTFRLPKSDLFWHGSFLLLTSSSALFSIAVITAITSFFRTVGGVFGIAIFGSYYQNVLATQLATLNLDISATALAQDFSLVKNLPAATRIEVQEAFVYALDKMRILIVPFAGVAFFISLFIEHHELRRRPSVKAQQPESVVVIESNAEGEVENPASEKGESTEQEYARDDENEASEEKHTTPMALYSDATASVDDKHHQPGTATSTAH
jgi:hypothetical protein